MIKKMHFNIERQTKNNNREKHTYKINLNNHWKLKMSNTNPPQQLGWKVFYEGRKFLNHQLTEVKCTAQLQTRGSLNTHYGVQVILIVEDSRFIWGLHCSSLVLCAVFSRLLFLCYMSFHLWLLIVPLVLSHTLIKALNNVLTWPSLSSDIEHSISPIWRSVYSNLVISLFISL